MLNDIYSTALDERVDFGRYAFFHRLIVINFVAAVRLRRGLQWYVVCLQDAALVLSAVALVVADAWHVAEVS